MTSPTDTFAAAHQKLDDMGNALLAGAAMAPRLTMDTIIALRSVLDRHAPHGVYRERTVCIQCGLQWPCADAADVLKVLGQPEDDDEGIEQ